MNHGFGLELGYCIGSDGRDGGVLHGLRIEAGYWYNLA
jgi:hypothetical protein